MAKVTLTNMCMIYDKEKNKVLVQDRIKSWQGISFPGGHVEDGESLIDSTIREVKEETGLTVSNLEPCGVIYWFNNETGEKFFVFNYRTNNFSGNLLDNTDEGRISWVDKDELLKLNLAEGMRDRLPMFFDKKYSEGFGVWNEHTEGQLKWQ
ncbi:8-oxo-dGTP diphosphatase [Bacillus sp. EB01]|uniref:8-oxo-dGTP diphosphatase n=1 Tax=Bacillus sp. EB01 TaxID=1347086 RepID=UPI0005C5B1A4|nr:8-oxo-dGTP diphosphatase [Bacillus sp. EB01]